MKHYRYHNVHKAQCFAWKTNDLNIKEHESHLSAHDGTQNQGYFFAKQCPFNLMVTCFIVSI